ncbi:THUMP-like domain-containing protein [Tessaracoccus sp. G1721]
MIPPARLDALAAAALEPDPSSLGAAGRLRAAFGPEDAAWALTQAALRRRARAKFARADEMLFTHDGLEQATRDTVRRWRAARFAAAGVATVWDLGCGIGADAMAFAEVGLEVHAVDADPATVEAASWNLALVGAGPAQVARAEESAVPRADGVFLDPARRTARGRTWHVADFTPPWQLVLDHLASPRFVCVKLGPGLPKELIPGGVRATWVSDGGDVVEVSLWNRLPEGRSAVLLSGGDVLELTAADGAQPPPVDRLGAYVYEPDGAAIRAGLVGEAVPGAWLLDPHVAYLTSDNPVETPWATRFQVLDVLDYSVKALRGYVRERGIGTLEIKKRAIDVDPAALRRELRPKGSAAATIILARTPGGTKAIVARRG